MLMCDVCFQCTMNIITSMFLLSLAGTDKKSEVGAGSEKFEFVSSIFQLVAYVHCLTL